MAPDEEEEGEDSDAPPDDVDEGTASPPAFNPTPSPMSATLVSLVIVSVFIRCW